MSDKKLTGDPRVDFGWFSRRYETAERHREAQDKRDAEKGSAAKAEQVVERRTERAAKMSQEQILQSLTSASAPARVQSGSEPN